MSTAKRAHKVLHGEHCAFCGARLETLVRFGARCPADVPLLRTQLTAAGGRVRSRVLAIRVRAEQGEVTDAVLRIVQAYLAGGVE